MTGRSTDLPSGIDLPRLPFEALLEAVPDAILLVDSHGRIEHGNTRAEELFGHQRDALIGGDMDAAT